MTQLTIELDEQTLAKAQRVANEQRRTLHEMVTDFVEEVAAQANAKDQGSVHQLQESFARLSRNMGQRTWRREDLYER